MYNPDKYLDPVLWNFYVCFLLFCSDLYVFILPTLLDNIQRPNWKSAQGPWDGDIQLFIPSLSSVLL